MDEIQKKLQDLSEEFQKLQSGILNCVFASASHVDKKY